MPLFTVAVLCYGDYPDYAVRALTPLIEPARRGLIDLVVAGNELSTNNETRILELLGSVGRTDFSPENRLKYPVVRRLFLEQPTAPLVMWFDDDSYLAEANVDMWFRRAAELMRSADVIGSKFVYKTLRLEQVHWVRSRPWYNKKPIPRQPFFPVGGWWAARSSVLKKFNWPDPEIRHRGGDVMFGVLIDQQQLNFANFTTRHGGVRVNVDLAGGKLAPRRGYDEKPVGSNFKLPNAPRRPPDHRYQQRS